MKNVLAGAVAALSLFSSALSSPVDKFRQDVDSEFQKRAGTFAITGVKDGSGTQPRISLRSMINNADQYNLYLLALTNFKWMDQSQMTSYYQVAGIHGVPNIPWDGVNANPNSNGAVGYCTHSSPLFPVWHRAYLALFEQVFLSVVQATVQSFPSDQQARWAAAAKNMRIPYWDWAQGPGKAPTVVPTQLTDKYVTITTPSGQQTIINPIFRFDFHPLDKAAMLYDPWDFWPVTLRYPQSASDPGTSSQPAQVTSSVQNAAQGLHDQIYNLLTQCADYTEMSNDAAQSVSPNCQNSLEGIHDSIHNLMGGPNDGHMTYLWWAAFDPVFWIHHANVDRLFAMWQVLYPSSYLVNSQTHASTFTIPQGTTVNANTPLDPFHRDTNGGSWTGAAVRDLTIFGYTYPEISQAAGNKATMQSIVNSLYGGAGGSGRKMLRSRRARRSLVSDIEGGVAGAVNDAQDAAEGKEPSDDKSIVGDVTGGITGDVAGAANNLTGGLMGDVTDGINDGLNSVLNALPAALAKLLSPTGRTSDWSANIVTQRFSLNSSYTIYCFVGDYDASNPAGWASEPNLAGSMGVFAQKGMGNMGEGKPLLVSSSVPLTTTLVQRIASGNLTDLDDSNVTPFLQKNLRWAIMTSDVKSVAPEDVPGLQVTVTHTPVTPATSDAVFPVYAPANILSNVTHGLPGGLQNDAQWDYWNSDDSADDEDCE